VLAQGGVGLALVVAALGLAVAAVQLQDTTFSMTFRVQKDQFDQALAESKELLKFAEDKKMSPNTQMFIRNARDKVDGALKEFANRQIDEKAAEDRKKVCVCVCIDGWVSRWLDVSTRVLASVRQKARARARVLASETGSQDTDTHTHTHKQSISAILPSP